MHRLFSATAPWRVLAVMIWSGFTAASAATLSGHVKDAAQSPAADTQVVIPALQKGVLTDGDGRFTLGNLPPGTYAVEFRRVGYTPIVRSVDLSKGDMSLDVSLADTPLPLPPITITAAPQPASALTTPASVTVVEGRTLDRRRGESVMSAIQDQPGVNMIDEGPTVVKPVIRGLSSQDIVVVEDGLRSESLQWGNEHAPEIDALGASRIEVMRGPNSLLYGSDALGGVVSISHPELPSAALGAGPLSGRFTTDFNSVNHSAGQMFEASGAQGDWGYRANVSQQQAGNYQTPQQGVVPNTGNQEVSGSGDIGLHRDWGTLALTVGHFSKRVELQNPGSPGWPDAPLDDLEYQTLKHDHDALRSTLDTTLARWDLTLGYDRVNREEFDAPNAPDNPPTLHWTQGNYTFDAKAHLAPMGPLDGTAGFSGVRRVEQSLGTTHLTPGYNQNGFGEYLVENLPWGKFNLTAGIRGDQNVFHVNSDDQVGVDNPVDGTAHPVSAQTLNYSAASGALGGVYHLTDPLAFAVNLGRGYRNPIPFELFAYGEHEGEGVFQIGNAGLSPETSLNTDASIRWSSPRLKAEVGIFRNVIHNYIYGTYTGGFTSDGLPIVQETQADAVIKGVDGAVNAAVTDWLTMKATYNLVRGYNDSGDPTLPSDYLPRVPADNVLIGADVHGRTLGAVHHPYLGVETRLTAAHARVAPEEIPTAGYGVTDLHTGGEFVVMNNRITLDAGVNNLFNKGYIDFNSIVKESNIQNPGRNVYVKLSVPFGS